MPEATLERAQTRMSKQLKRKLRLLDYNRFNCLPKSSRDITVFVRFHIPSENESYSYLVNISSFVKVLIWRLPLKFNTAIYYMACVTPTQIDYFKGINLWTSNFWPFRENLKHRSSRQGLGLGFPHNDNK